MCETLSNKVSCYPLDWDRKKLLCIISIFQPYLMVSLSLKKKNKFNIYIYIIDIYCQCMGEMAQDHEINDMCMVYLKVLL